MWFYVLHHQFFQPEIHAFFSRSMFFFSISCTCINPPSPFQQNAIVHIRKVLFKVMISQLLVVSLFEFRIINSLNSFFWYKHRNNSGSENWDSETLYVWLHPYPLLRFNLVPTLYSCVYKFQKSYQFTRRKQEIKDIFLLTCNIVDSIIFQLLLV